MNNKPGRIRIRLAELLSVELGWLIDPSDLWPQQGAWRTDVRLDVFRWEGLIPGDELIPHQKGRKVGVYCWDSMTDCVRYGVGAEMNRIGGLEVWALAPNDPKGKEQKQKATQLTKENKNE